MAKWGRSKTPDAGIPRVFVSYRREDSSAYAGRLYDDLTEEFGEDNVFIDIDSLVPGSDFVDAIEETLASCDMVLVVIGRAWLSVADAHGRRRLDNGGDFVSMEISSALERAVGVIPVLVGGAEMPDAEELPEALTRLARRHAIDLSDRRWRADVRDLVVAIEKAKNRRPEVTIRPAQKVEGKGDDEVQSPDPPASREDAIDKICRNLVAGAKNAGVAISDKDLVELAAPQSTLSTRKMDRLIVDFESALLAAYAQLLKQEQAVKMPQGPTVPESWAAAYAELDRLDDPPAVLAVLEAVLGVESSIENP